MQRASLLTLTLVLGSAPMASGGTFEPHTYLDSPAEIPADPEAPIAVAQRGLVAHWHGSLIHLRDPGLVLQGTMRMDDRPTAMIFSESGRYLITGHADGAVRLLIAGQNAQPQWTAQLKSPVRSIASSPGSRYLAVVTEKELVLLSMERGQDKGRLSAKKAIYAGFPTTDWVGVVQRGKVTFAPVGPKGLASDDAKVKKVKGGTVAACTLSKWKGLLLGGGAQVGLLEPKAKRPRSVIKRKAAGSPIGLSSGTHLLAVLQKGAQSVRFFDARKGFAPAGELALRFRTVGAMAFAPGDQALYCALVKDGRARLDAIDVHSGRPRRGSLPGDAMAHQFGPDGGLHCLAPRHEETPDAKVHRFRFDPEAGSLEELGAHPGELLRFDRTRFIVRRPRVGLVVVARADGNETPLTPPKDLAGQTPTPRADLILFSDEDDEQHTVWDPLKNVVLGTWSAPGHRYLVLTPDRQRAVTLRDRELRCVDAKGQELWTATTARGAPRLELAAESGGVLLPGVGVYDLDDGSLRFALPAVGAHVTSGDVVLRDQENRRKERAVVLNPNSGRAEHAIPFLPPDGARVRSGLELLDADPATRWLLLRRHGGAERGLWLYRLSE